MKQRAKTLEARGMDPTTRRLVVRPRRTEASSSLNQSIGLDVRTPALTPHRVALPHDEPERPLPALASESHGAPPDVRDQPRRVGRADTGRSAKLLPQ